MRGLNLPTMLKEFRASLASGGGRWNGTGRFGFIVGTITAVNPDVKTSGHYLVCRFNRVVIRLASSVDYDRKLARLKSLHNFAEHTM